MAEVITRFKLETTQYDSKLRDASKQLNEYARLASLAGKDFDKFSKGNVEAARALGNIQTSAKDARGRLKELVGAFNDAAKAYNSLSKEQQKSDWAKALAESIQTLKGRIGEAKKELYDVGSAGKGTGGVMDALSQKFMLNVDAMKLLDMGLSATKSALGVVKDAFMASETNVDDWGRTVSSAESIYNTFIQSLNSGNFSNFFSNLDGVISRAKEAYNALDSLNTVMTIVNPERARLQARQTELKSIIRREGAGSAAGQAAQAELKQLETSIVNAFKVEQKLNYDAFKALVNQKLAEGGVRLDKASYNLLMRSFSDVSAYNQLKANASGGVYQRYESANGWGSYKTTTDTRNTNQKLLDLFTDEWRQANSAYLTAAFNARGAAASAMLGDARYLKSGGGSGGGGGTLDKAFTSQLKLPEFGAITIATTESMAELNAQLAAFKKALAEATDPIAYGRAEAGIKSIEDKMRVQPFAIQAGVSTTTALAAEGVGKKLREMVQTDLDKMDLSAYRTGASSEDKKTTEDLLAQASKITSGLSSVASGLQAMGIKLPDGVSKFINGIQGAISVVQGIQTVLSVFSTSSQASQTLNTTALNLNTSAIYTLAGALATNTAVSSIPLFARGGVVHAADGFSGIVPGTHYSGDNIPIMANAGEVVLNRAQSSVIAGALSGGEEKYNSSRTPYVSGEMIYLGLKNYLRRSGRGELVTAR